MSEVCVAFGAELICQQQSALQRDTAVLRAFIVRAISSLARVKSLRNLDYRLSFHHKRGTENNLSDLTSTYVPGPIRWMSR